MLDTRGPAALAQQLTHDGYLPPRWQKAIAAVDRGRFVPDRIWIRSDDGYTPVDRALQPDRWAAAVYSDTSVVTQVADPDGPVAYVPTSSASMPRMVTTMLDALNAQAGHRVLEVGTGTGYNAALLAHQLGDASVTSIEMDAGLAEQARASLKTAGYAPTVLTGDGSAGCPGRAPYDGVIATYAVHTVPYAWIQQTRDRGTLVLPWGTGLYNGVLIHLTVHHDDERGPAASGQVIGDSAFMWDRTQTPDRDVMACVHDQPHARPSRTALDPRRVLGDEDMAFTAGILVPGARYSVGHGPDGEFTLWLADTDTGSGSWASVDYEPHMTEFAVEQHGPRMLWDEIEAAHHWWTGIRRPARTEYGMTITPEAQHLWVGQPHHRVATIA